MVKCPNKNLPEWKELERLCPNTAYVVWDAFPHGIDKAPNGADSKLFKDLLEYYHGDRDAAIVAKGETALWSFGRWANDGVIRDSNGEPTIMYVTKKARGKVEVSPENTSGSTYIAYARKQAVEVPLRPFTAPLSDVRPIDVQYVKPAPKSEYRKLSEAVQAARNAGIGKGSAYNSKMYDLVSQYDNSSDLINALIEAGAVEDSMIPLAKLLAVHSADVAVYTHRSGDGTLAEYSTKHSIIGIYADAFYGQSDNLVAETILHEALHHYLVGQYEFNEVYEDAVNRVQNIYRKLAGDDANKFYGLRAEGDEFVNEVLTNSAFRMYLRELDDKPLNRLKRAIVSVLRSLGLDLKSTITLDQLTRSLTNLVDSLSKTKVTRDLIEDIRIARLARNENMDINNAIRHSKKSDAVIKDIDSRAKVVKGSIDRGMRSRIKALKQYGAVTNSAVRSLENELAKLQEMFERNEDRQAMLDFIKHAYNESERPVMAIDAAYREFEETGEFALKNNQLVQLYRDFIGFYEPVIDDIYQKLFVTNYFNDDSMSKEEQEYLGNIIESTRGDFAAIRGKYDVLLANRFGTILKANAHEYESKAIDEYLKDNINTTSSDINLYVTYIGGMRNANDEALRIVARRVTDINNSVSRKTIDKGAEILPLFAEVKNWQPFYERDANGDKTGYLVRDRNYGEFKADFDEFKESIGEAPIGDDDALQAWNKTYNDWLGVHAERRYKPAYYALFNSMGMAAKQARDSIQFEISKILAEYTNKDGIVESERMPDSLWNTLQNLYQEKRHLSSRYMADGTPKTGIDLEIAEDIRRVNEALTNELTYLINEKRFEEIRKQKEAELSKAQYEKWYSRNTRWAYTEAFIDKLDKLEKKFYSEEYNRLSEESKDLKSMYRNNHDFMVNTARMPEVVKDRIKELDMLMAEEMDKVDKVKIEKAGIQFKKIASVIKSAYYMREKKAAIELDEKRPGAYKEWFDANHYLDAYGKYKPYSYFNLMKPHEESAVYLAPSREYTEIDPSSPMWNENFDHTSREHIQPKKDLYDNTKAYEAAIDTPAKKKLYETIEQTMAESNEKITFLKYADNYKLPQISGSTYAHIKAKHNLFKGIASYMSDTLTVRDDDAGYNMDSVAPDGTSLPTIPTHFMAMLKNPAAITNDLAGSIMKYYQMAENFKQKQEVMPELQLIQNHIDNRLLVRDEEDTSIAGKLADGVKYKLNGKGRTNASVRMKRYMETNIFGNEYVPLKIGKYNIVKALMIFKTYATTVNLGGNIFVAAANFTGSMHQHMAEALTGVYYTSSTALAAMRTTAYYFGKSILNGADYTKGNKVLSLMNMNQVGRDIDQMYKRLNYNKLARFFMNHKWYGLMTAGDFSVKGNILTSVYMNTKFVPEEGRFMMRDEYLAKHYGEKGAGKRFSRINTVTLFDMYKSKGTTVELNPAKAEYAQYVTPALTKRVQNVIQFLAQRADGMMDSSEKNAAQANAISGFAFMHKSFILSALDDRVLKPTGYNYMLERDDEASYKTVAKRIIEMISNIYQWTKWKVLHNRASYTGERPSMKLKKLEFYESYNIKRVTREAGLIIAYMLVSSIMNADDDSDDDWLESSLKYVVDRSKYEAQNLFNPWDIVNSFKTVTPAMSSLENIKSVAVMVGSVWNWEDNLDRGIKYGAYKDMSPIERAAIKSTPLKNIIEATEPKQKHKYLKGQLD